MNKVFRKIHLWLSVPVGLIITVICLTGAALVFERDITESLNPKIYKVAYTEGDPPLPRSPLTASRFRIRWNCSPCNCRVNGTSPAWQHSKVRESVR